MTKDKARDLFQLQTDLIDAKVEVGVSKAIDRLIAKIDDLKSEMHGFRHEMNDRLSSLDSRVIAVETKLGIVNKNQEEIRSRFIDYAFKAGWLILGVFITYTVTQFHTLANFIK